MKEFRLVALAALAALAVGGIGVADGLSDRRATEQAREAAEGSAPQCAAVSRDELVPADGALFGVNLDLGNRSLADYAQDLGHRAAVSVSFTGFPYDSRGHDYLLQAAEQIRASGRTMLLTLEPEEGLAAVTDETARALAADLHEINETGVPVVVRFAHEMNGSWYAWGQQPTAYVETFRTVAAAVHEHAPGSAMMWAPNYGGGYPFSGGQHEAEPGGDDFAVLDTDGDGALTMADDAYAPYYPGDDAVDWVGMSLYHWGSAHPWGENELSEPDKFADQLTGGYDGSGGDDTAVPDFYATYGEEHGKPVAIPETAALWVPGGGGAGELEVKRSWWEQVFDPALPERFPQLKMINWFEWDKHEVEVDGRVDWTTTTDDAVRTEFVQALPEWLHFAPEGGC